MRTRIKFCGITSADDAAAAARAGADAIGMVFYPPAKVAVSIDEAVAIMPAVPPLVTTVALFVNATAQEIQRVIDRISPQVLQFHGDETAEFCQQFNLPYLRVCRVRQSSDITQTAHDHPQCSGLLLDSYVAGTAGGTGTTFDWRQIPADCGKPYIIAGGLSAANVSDLIRTVRPWGVDVSSGISETNDRRRKNWDKMLGFVRSVRHADDC